MNVCDWCFEKYEHPKIEIHTIDEREINLSACSEECFEQIVLDFIEEQEGTEDEPHR